ncbi:hypothetical protein GH741_13255 [Aquibacillus halophilus]|uniref:Spore coat protein n=1 Tax=Aquibacillus halophilus TaxID=930132 RepID=A0A6A8DIL1_9BACI|nr:YppG family protein [Aquibacillus halophilus]MRH43639.1 hypothetical protein [Aquibacillus halophilus]
MTNFRAPYFPQQNYNYMQSFPYPEQPPQNQNIGMIQGNDAPISVSPYHYFAKPLQPIEQPVQQAQHWNTNYQPVPNAPKQPLNQPPTKGLISYFQDSNGQVDIDKMLNTVGQMANTYHQVSPIVKGIGSFVKGFR